MGHVGDEGDDEEEVAPPPPMPEEEALRYGVAAMAPEQRAALRARVRENLARAEVEWEAKLEADRRRLFDAHLAMAERATGLTREELLAEAARLEPFPDSVPAPQPRRVLPAELQAAAGVEELHRRDDLEECPALAAVRVLSTAPRGHILVLVGELGVGKSGTACWLLGQHEGGAYQRARELGHVCINDRDRWQRLLSARAVVLDDLGTEEGPTPFWKGCFNELIDAWYARCTRVVITTNLGQEAWKARKYGDRVMSRLTERGRWVVYSGPSRRVRGH